MGETARKMVGLAIMVASVFAFLFGLHPAAGWPAFAGPVLVASGLLLFLFGTVLYQVIRKD